MAYLGKTPSQAVRSRYFYTATGGETSLSGADNNGDTLIFADGNYVDVYLNGVLLVAGTDYNVNTTNTIAGLVALTASDIVEIVVYDTFSVFGGTFQGALTADSINADIFGSHQFTAKNVQGSTILKGTPVYIAGHSGNDSEIAIADADVAAKMPAFGIAATDIANNTKGNVVVFGNYIGIDTSAFAVGDELYVSNTGTLTTTRPSGSADKVQKIAKVIRSQSQNGQIFVMGAGRSNDTPNAITTNSINLSSSTTVSSVLDEDAMTSNSATALATQQSIKAYVDNQIGSNNELSEILTNGNTTGGNNIAFGDNDKAIFGAGSDLQIYHDSTAGNSYIDDAGTGWLYLRADERVLVASQSTGNISAKFFTNAQAELAYNNATKIATTATGVDVTGTVTADDLDLSVGTAGDGIQVTSTGANYLNLGFDTNRTGASQTLSQIEQKWNGTTVARMLFVTGSDTTNKDDAEIRFQTASAGTPSTAMTISSAGNVGIGGDAGGYRLHVQNTDNGGTVYGRVLNACTAGTNSTAQMHVGTTSNTLLLSANEQFNYTQMSQAGNAINHYFDMDNYYFRNKAGTQYLAMTGGRINTQSRNYGLVTHTTGITLADNASTTISAATAGGGILAIYNSNSGRHATFGVGYGAVYLIGQSHSGVYVAGDVDGKFGIYSGGGHSFTLINRLGSSSQFAINLFMAGSNAA